MGPRDYTEFCLLWQNSFLHIKGGESLTKEKRNQSVFSVIKAFQILELLNQKGSLTISQIHSTLHFNKSTISRLLNTLTELGYTQKISRNAGYVNTLKLFEMGNREVERLGVRRMAQPYLKHLACETKETINLAVLSGIHLIYIDKIESPDAIRVGYGSSKRIPAYCTGLGKAILAFMSKEKQEKLLVNAEFVRFTPTTITSQKLFKKDLDETKKRGYAYDNCEYEEGLACVAAPIINAGGEVIASISIAYPRARYVNNPEEEQRFAHLICTAARSLSLDLSYMGDNLIF